MDSLPCGRGRSPALPVRENNSGLMPFLGRQGYSEDKCLGVQVEAAFVGVLILAKVPAPVLSDEVVVAEADDEVLLPPRTLRVDRRERY